ncbi:MAG: Non-canonical purine NTP pyrophosphatase [Deltaproteobacteria bacterium]|nr:MAG: Non-canonical purine NTP pyrophosphatase [Deltaproteobacteria bacterium]
MNEQVIVLATKNNGKKKELNSLLKKFPVKIMNLDDFGPIPEIIEDGESFDDNAYKKASLTARYLGYTAMADDSGLVVNSLEGRPGVYSARYAGENADDLHNIEKLLKEMEHIDDRSAAFECVISIAVPTGHALTYEGRCEGLITREPMGTGGFGYDPVFYYPDFKKTFAEISMEEKSKISHRGKALQEVCNEMDKVLVWIEQNLPKLEKFKCH